MARAHTQAILRRIGRWTTVIVLACALAVGALSVQLAQTSEEAANAAQPAVQQQTQTPTQDALPTQTRTATPTPTPTHSGLTASSGPSHATTRGS